MKKLLIFVFAMFVGMTAFADGNESKSEFGSVSEASSGDGYVNIHFWDYIKFSSDNHSRITYHDGTGYVTILKDPNRIIQTIRVQEGTYITIDLGYWGYHGAYYVKIEGMGLDWESPYNQASPAALSFYVYYQSWEPWESDIYVTVIGID